MATHPVLEGALVPLCLHLISRPRPEELPVKGSAGFTMVEMLVTAFLLAVGILGLCALQVMALQAVQSGRGATTAILLAEQTMDRVEVEGRLSWLHLTDGCGATPPTADLEGLRYIVQAPGVPQQDFFTVQGTPVPSDGGDRLEDARFYTVTTHRMCLQGGLPTGQLSEFTVVVTYMDGTDRSKAPIPRTVTLVRRVAHG